MPCYRRGHRKETGSLKWTWFSVLYALGIAYIVSLVIYQGGRLFGIPLTGKKGYAMIVSVILGALIFGYAAYTLVRFVKKSKMGKCATCSLSQSCSTSCSIPSDAGAAFVSRNKCSIMPLQPSHREAWRAFLQAWELKYQNENPRWDRCAGGSLGEESALKIAARGIIGRGIRAGERCAGRSWQRDPRWRALCRGIIPPIPLECRCL